MSQSSLWRMSHLKTVPDGQKPQECVRNAGQSKPSIPYTCKNDSGGSRLQCLHPEAYVAPQDGVVSPCMVKRDSEAVPRACSASHYAIRQRVLLTASVWAIMHMEECVQKLTRANEALANYKREGTRPDGPQW